MRGTEWQSFDAFCNISIRQLGWWGGGSATTAPPVLLALLLFIFIPIEDEEVPGFPPLSLFDDRNENQPKTLDFARGEVLGFELDFELGLDSLLPHCSLASAVPITVAAA